MDGLQELAEAMLQLRVQIGYPRGLQGLSDRVNHPMYSTGIGLALYGETLRQLERENNTHALAGMPLDHSCSASRNGLGY